jgi:hypothetical protein
MRELYATELRSPTRTNGEALPLVEAWAGRHEGETGRPKAEVSTIENDDSSRTITMQQIDDGAGLRWMSEISLGPATELAHVTVQIRLGSVGTAGIAPIDYDFGTPAIVRSLVRDLEMCDGTVRILADPGPEVGPSDVPDLISLLENTDRTLPVIVVSRSEPSGNAALNVVTLHRELAGLAHVRVLSSAASGWALTNDLGADLSVWGGAIRVYFAGFTRNDNPRRHRITFPERVDETTTSRIRSWLGTLAAAATPEHPAVARRREERRALAKAAADSDDLGQLREYIALLEADNDEARRSADEYKERTAELSSALALKESELEQVRENFVDLQRSLATTGENTDEVSVTDSDAVSSVASAMDAVEQLARTTYYRPRVTVTAAAMRSGRRFSQYARPEDLLRACQTVLEAGALYHDNRLGMSPAEFFSQRGYGYGAAPSPHLKVDESTSPDQCLRVYWDEDSTSRTWSVTSIGEHA